MATFLLFIAAQAAVTAATYGINRLTSRLSDQALEGPRTSDVAIQASAFGPPLPLHFGTVRAPGNIIWSQGLRETASTDQQQVGGKGGGSSTVSSTTYSYTASFAVAVNARPVQEVRRIWADGKLLRSADGRLAVPGQMRFYPGTEDQLPDPLIEADRGTANCPAFRGLAYAVFEDLALGDFANRIPILSFELSADPASTADRFYRWVAEQAALALTGAPVLARDPVGLSLDGGRSVRDGVEALGQVAPADILASGATLALSARPATVRAAALAQDLVPPAAEGGPVPFVLTRPDAADRPGILGLVYADPARDYQSNLQRAARQAGPSRRVQESAVPLTLSAADAKAAAVAQLREIWQAGDRLSLRLPWRFLRLSAGDRLRVEPGDGGPALEVGIERLTVHDGVMEVDGRVLAGSGAVPSMPAESGLFPPQTVAPAQPLQLAMLDLPLLPGAEPAQAGFPIHGALWTTGGGGRGGTVLISEDGGESYAVLAAASVETLTGQVLGSVPPGPADRWDEATQILVRLDDPEAALESAGATAVLNGANLAAIGSELLQFREAVQQPDGSFALRGLLRGRLGTEAATAGHPPDARFVLLRSGTFVSAQVPLSHRGRPVLVKAVGPRQMLDEATPQTLTAQARALHPYAPVHPQIHSDGAGGVVIRWVRRTRYGGAWLDGTDVPLGEAAERYEVDILQGSAPVRTLATAAPEAAYGAAAFAQDFPVRPQSLAFHVYQISEAVGRGAPLRAVLPVPPA